MGEYLHFTFDGVSSNEYNLVILNTGEDLSFPSQPAFENQIVSPLYQGTSYLAGVNKKERTFDFNCWIDSIDNKTVRSLLSWLSVDKIGKLILDYNPDFYYNVKVSSISNWKHLAVNSDNTVNYEFSLSFVTIEDFAAISNTSYTNINGTTPDGYIRGVNEASVGSVNTVYFYNTYTEPFYLNFSIPTTTTSFNISRTLIGPTSSTAVKYYDYDSYNNSTAYSLNTKNGFIVNTARVLIENSANLSNSVNLGPMPIVTNIGQGIATIAAGPSLSLSSGVPNNSNVRYYVGNSNINTTLYTNTSISNIITDFSLVENDTVVINYLYPVKINYTNGLTYSFNYRDKF